MFSAINEISIPLELGLGAQPQSFQDAVTTRNHCIQPDAVLPIVSILLCTYHGHQYLADQPDSFAAQSYPDWEMRASDDGSQHFTRAILELYRDKWGADLPSIPFRTRSRVRR